MSILLITSTSICVIANIIPIIVKYIVAWMFSEYTAERSLKLELIKLEQEMSKISMVDEFSRYTKIQRKHSKLKENHKNQISARISARTKAQLFFLYSAKIIKVVIMMVMMKMYREHPVIVLPKGTLWPLNYIFSWPGSDQDSISLIIWIAIISLVIPRLFTKVNSFVN